jgi:hypothetical protein
MEGDMTGQRPSGMDYENLGEEHYCRRGLYFLRDIFWFGVWVNCCRGHQVAGSFGLGGQESSQNPGAREPDRLLLAGWVVSRFWVGFGQSIRQSFGQSSREDSQILGK